MIERFLFDILTEAIANLSSDNARSGHATLRRIFSQPGREEAEVDKLVAYFLSPEGKPQVRHGYSVGGPAVPSYTIILGGEETDDNFLGDAIGPSPAADSFVAQVEKELGRAVDAAGERVSLTYTILVYTEHPDVCIAYYVIARDALREAKRRLIAEGFEPAKGWISGGDVMPDPKYAPERLYIRQITLKGSGMAVWAYDVDLGPFASGRATRVAGIHVANHVLGVNPKVHALEDADGEED